MTSEPLRVDESLDSTAPTLVTERLELRAWSLDDAPAALPVYGHPDVARWLSPAMDRVADVAAMRLLIQTWSAEDARLVAPAGRWTVALRDTGEVIGGAVLLPLPPGNEDLEIGWQLNPNHWGKGYATEITHSIAKWAFTQDVDEVFAVVRPRNERAAAVARKTGMQWVGETEKYYGLTLQVFRLRKSDLT
jgi:RimJ/RimL family protein N-acetyltransferase